MSQAVSIWKFTTFFALYALASLAAYFTTSFTIPAWLIYLFILSPFYIVCILYLISFSLKHRQEMLRYRRLPLYLSVISQFLIILTSPASCYGWNQGKACYSFIQTHLTKNSLTSFQNTPPHWSMVELMLLIALLLHVISVVAFLKMIRIEKQ